MLSWHIETLTLELKYTWKISRNASETKTNFFVRVTNGTHTGIGEAAPNVRYNETPELLTEQFKALETYGLDKITSFEELLELLKACQPANALRFAVESAYVHFICLKQNLTIPDFLGLEEPVPVPTTFSLPIMEPGNVPGFISENNLERFSALKIKVNQETGLDTIAAVSKVYFKPLLIDTNEAWTEPETLLVFLEKLKPYNILFLEQPMPAEEIEAYKYLKKKSPYEIYADESVTDTADFEALQEQFHGVNMKLMKAGGYLNGRHILEQTKAFGLKTMIGCMVETSLGIWSAMQLSRGVQTADLDGFLIVKTEPFKIVREENGWLYLK